MDLSILLSWRSTSLLHPPKILSMSLIWRNPKLWFRFLFLSPVISWLKIARSPYWLSPKANHWLRRTPLACFAVLHQRHAFFVSVVLSSWTRLSDHLSGSLKPLPFCSLLLFHLFSMRTPALPQAYNQFDNDSMDAFYPLENGSGLKGSDLNTQDIISYYLMGIATTSICCVGIIGNILSLIVLSKPTMRTGTTHMYLIALAISDTLVLIFTILTALKDTRSPYQSEGAASYQAWADVPFVAQSYPICHAFAILFQVSSWAVREELKKTWIECQ